MSLFTKTLATLAVTALLAPSGAFANTASSQSSNSGVNNQSNSGTVVQNPSGGSQTNINQNNAYSSTYSFGPGISCPTPSVAVSAFGANGNAWGGGYNSGSGNYGASVSLIYPLGGDVGESCKKLVAEIAQQRVLDTKVNMINVCATFAQQGVKIDVAKFPEFEVCSAVTVAGRQAVGVEPQRVFTPPDSAVPVVPVSKN